MEYQSHRILIWAKTYPELSTKYLETVCTAGVLEDGNPVRLYPIQFRYLDTQFHKYQWIKAGIAKNPMDSRPESYRVDADTIECEEVIPTTPDEWGKRAAVIFKNKDWQFESVDQLQEAQKSTRLSIGVVRPRKILDVRFQERTPDDAKGFDEKMARLRTQVAADRNQLDLFESST
jgi:hypothetical protein